MRAPHPENEAERLAVLARHGTRDADVASELEEIARLAARVAAAPAAYVGFVDADRVQVLARVGAVPDRMPRDVASPAWVLLGDDVLVVEDANADPRFAADPLVLGDPPFRFFAGAPLLAAPGIAIGVLAVLDREPRTLAASDREALAVLARQVMARLELRRIQVERRQWSEQVIRHQAALRDLARRDLSDWGGALEVITEMGTDILGVERASVWLFDEGRELVCADLYCLGSNTHISGDRLQSDKYPCYFRAIEEARAVAVNDVRHDPRTVELVSEYLQPLGIASLLDDPIHLHGALVGILCHEHVGAPRRWTVEEQDFSAALADRVALALEARRRTELEAQLRATPNT